MTGTFVDTVCICTLTGLTIMTSGAYEYSQANGLEGVEVTAAAFGNGLPMGIFGRYVYSDDSTGILRIHDDPGLGLLRRKISGIPDR